LPGEKMNVLVVVQQGMVPVEVPGPYHMRVYAIC
jgi:hypothetical protein